MRLDILSLLVIGYTLHASNAAGNDKDVRIKINLPEVIHKHKQTIYKQSPTIHHEYSISEDGKNIPVIVHNQDYNNPEEDYTHKEYAYKPEKKKSKNKKAGKIKSKKEKKKYGNDQDFKAILENYDSKPETTDGLKQSYHTEHYEVKKINPNAKSPDEKYIIQGAYKVQDTDPWGRPTTAFHKYDSPISKIEASILSKYDYTNFRPGEDFRKEKEGGYDHDNIEYGNYNGEKKKSKHNDEGYDHENIEYDNYGSEKEKTKHSDESYDYSPNYNKYSNQKKNQDYNYETPKDSSHEKDYETAAGYQDFVNEKKAHYTAPLSYVHVQPKYEPHHVHQGRNPNKNQKIQIIISPANIKVDDNSYRAPQQKAPVDIEYENASVERQLEYEFEKEFGHLIQPGHSDHHHHDGEWEKHLIDYIYGQNHAASNKFVQKVRPHNVRKA